MKIVTGPQNACTYFFNYYKSENLGKPITDADHESERKKKFLENFRAKFLALYYPFT